MRLAAAILVAELILTLPGIAASTESANAVQKEDIIEMISVERISETIQDLEAFGTREFHLESSREAAEYLHGRFASLGLDVEYQTFMVYEVEVVNVVARTLGTSPESPRYLFGAHYDSENSDADNLTLAQTLPAPGADDDASGVAAVLELATVLSNTRLDVTVEFVAFGAEENGYDLSGGMAGSRHFASEAYERGIEYANAAIMDMIGYAEDENVMTLITNSENQLANGVAEAVDRYNLGLRVEQLQAAWIQYSDHASFWLYGYPSFLVTEEIDPRSWYPVNPNYHTENDTFSTLSVDQVAQVTKALAGGLLLDLVDPDKEGVLFMYMTTCVAAAATAVTIIALRRYRR